MKTLILVSLAIISTVFFSSCYPYTEGHYWGMHWVWWIIWVMFLIWIFATPWDIPGERRKKDTPLGILRRRYAAGEISKEEFEERKKTLEQS